MNSQTHNESLKTLLVFFPVLMLSLSPGLSGAQGCQFLLPWAASLWCASRQEHFFARWLYIGAMVLVVVGLGYHTDSSVLMSGIALLYVFIWL
ncbi:hypothetical protein D3C76_1106220 [compost metagenome]